MDRENFVRVWPRCFLVFMGVVLLIATIFLLLTELGNACAHFWLTNVFAGAWCGIIDFAFAIALFVCACCKPSPAAALRAVVIAFIALVANAACIGFNAAFIARTSTCLLTPSCSSYASSMTNFAANLQSSFLTNFRRLSAFSTYTVDQAKFLFQATQIGLASLCFILSLIFIIIYYVVKSKASANGQVRDMNPSPKRAQFDESALREKPSARFAPRKPQAAPGVLPWNDRKRY